MLCAICAVMAFTANLPTGTYQEHDPEIKPLMRSEERQQSRIACVREVRR